MLGGTPDALPGAPAVLKAAEDPDAKVRYQAMRAVGRMAAATGDKETTPAIGDKEATAALEKGLQDADKKVRAAAAESLAADVPSVKSNVTKLIALLKHKEPEVRVQAAKAIGGWARRASRRFPTSSTRCAGTTASCARPASWPSSPSMRPRKS